MSSIPVTGDTLATIDIARVHRDNSDVILSVDFSDDGEWLLTASADESIHVYSTATGLMNRVVFSKKYGCGVARFTHDNNSVLYASRNEHDDTVRYLSLHDNRYLRYFKGHRDRVTSLSVSPVNDEFVTGSHDHTARFWDLRTSACVGYVQTDAPAVVAHDSKGVVVAVGGANGCISLFDARKLGVPFASRSVSPKCGRWRDISFGPTGNDMICVLEDSYSYVYDTVVWEKRAEVGAGMNGRVECAALVPGAPVALYGWSNGVVTMHDYDRDMPIKQLEGHSDAVSAIRWCPTKMMFASGSRQLSMWIPVEDD